MIHVKVDLEETGVGHADDIAELLEASVCQVGATLDRQMSQLGVLFELISQPIETIVSEHVLIKNNGAQVGVRAQV